MRQSSKLIPHYFPFPKLKKWLGGKRFANNEQVKSTVDDYFAKLDGSRYKHYNLSYWTSLEKVYRSKRRLCRDTKILFFKFFAFSQLGQVFLGLHYLHLSSCFSIEYSFISKRNFPYQFSLLYFPKTTPRLGAALRDCRPCSSYSNKIKKFRTVGRYSVQCT